MAQPVNFGELGIRNTRDVNIALLGKLVWSLLHEKDKLWVEVLSHKYLKEKSILESECSNSCSYVWRTIHKIAAILKDGF